MVDWADDKGREIWEELQYLDNNESAAVEYITAAIREVAEESKADTERYWRAEMDALAAGLRDDCDAHIRDAVAEAKAAEREAVIKMVQDDLRHTYDVAHRNRLSDLIARIRARSAEGGDGG